MKYLILSICLFFSFGGFAQSKTLSPEISAEKVANLYNLDDVQKARCLELLKVKLKAIQDLDTNPGSLEVIQNQRIAINKNYNDEFEAILNPEQSAIFQKHRKISETPKAAKEAIKYSTSQQDSKKNKKAKQ